MVLEDRRWRSEPRNHLLFVLRTPALSKIPGSSRSTHSAAIFPSCPDTQPINRAFSVPRNEYCRSGPHRLRTLRARIRGLINDLPRVHSIPRIEISAFLVSFFARREWILEAIGVAQVSSAVMTEDGQASVRRCRRFSSSNQFSTKRSCVGSRLLFVANHEEAAICGDIVRRGILSLEQHAAQCRSRMSVQARSAPPSSGRRSGRIAPARCATTAGAGRPRWKPATFLQAPETAARRSRTCRSRSTDRRPIVHRVRTQGTPRQTVLRGRASVCGHRSLAAHKCPRPDRRQATWRSGARIVPAYSARLRRSGALRCRFRRTTFGKFPSSRLF